MRLRKGKLIFSASDLVDATSCPTLFEYKILNARREASAPVLPSSNHQSSLVIKKGLLHEKKYYASMQTSGESYLDITTLATNIETKVEKTIDAMHKGIGIIYQAEFQIGNKHGIVDFLKRIPGNSKFGPYQYEVWDTKFSKKEKAQYILQLLFYASLVSETQQQPVERVGVVFGDGKEIAYPTRDFASLVRHLTDHMEELSCVVAQTYPYACAKCQTCQYQAYCQSRWQTDQHVGLVAGIRVSQIKKLKEYEITTLQDLADCEVTNRIGIDPSTLHRLKEQARLQNVFQKTGTHTVELISMEEHALNQSVSGFQRLPSPDACDLYLDLEGFPFERLDYLWGLYKREHGQMVYQHWFAHDKEQEQQAFKEIVATIQSVFDENPNAHLYHYAPYEITALKRCMGTYAMAESVIDDWLRKGKLIDLYQVLRESIRTSEAGYSLKLIEHFYMGKREEQITGGLESVEIYDQYRESADITLLEQIRAYNERDVISTYKAHQWLLSLKPETIPFRQSIPESSDQEKPKIIAWEEELAWLMARLRELPERGNKLNEFLANLLDFYRREEKADWWSYFERISMSSQDRFADAECLAGVKIKKTTPVKRSLRYSCSFPSQECTLHANDSLVIFPTQPEQRPISVTNLFFDLETKTVEFTVGSTREVPEQFDLGKGTPVSHKKLSKRLVEFVDHHCNAPATKYHATYDMLARAIPKVTPRYPDGRLVSEKPTVTEITTLVNSLTNSYLVIQGPPGTGKTYTGARLIVDLLAKKKRVAISAFSHKAINNLFKSVEKLLQEHSMQVAGVKIESKNLDEFQSDYFETRPSSSGLDSSIQLVAGTVWAFSDSNFDLQFDYLFIDEAGQMSIANAIVLSLIANQVVILGDQMQLSQPCKGSHPPHTADSVLSYLLEDNNTIPPTHGVFLSNTYRMHPELCKFISDSIYEGRLSSDTSTSFRYLQSNSVTEIKPYGITTRYVEHQKCSAMSIEEVEAVKHICGLLLQHNYIDNGEKKPITAQDILVVTPYNLQVAALKAGLAGFLPRERIGTIDKFQGQEALVSIISLATSSAEYLTRDLEFLYSRNRINVALSRAKCLSIVVCSKQLLYTVGNTVEDLALVNFLCEVDDYAAGQLK
ncbi:MAG: TM0106 family RecB-like putative nuclease [Methylacidiphilales bacterium]|nr:TM0106 family RecB-like putative nuclease [Candidatus Methylacidiphilales bacterium]